MDFFTQNRSTSSSLYHRVYLERVLIAQQLQTQMPQILSLWTPAYPVRTAALARETLSARSGLLMNYPCSTLFLLKACRYWVTSCFIYLSLHVFVFVSRSVRCMERVCWCVKETATDSFTWSVLVWRPFLKADSPVQNVEMVSKSELINHIFSIAYVLLSSLILKILCHSRQSSLF